MATNRIALAFALVVPLLTSPLPAQEISLEVHDPGDSISSAGQIPFAPEGGGCPCIGGSAEGEPDCGLAGEDGIDSTNAGCNLDPHIFSPAICDQVICGTVGTKFTTQGDKRDTDWYQLPVNLPSNVRVELTPSFNALTGLFNSAGGPPSCGTVSSDWLYTPSSCNVGRDERSLSAGAWWVFVAPLNFSGIACGAPYKLVIRCPIFENGFESGNVCSWSFPFCKSAPEPGSLGPVRRR